MNFQKLNKTKHCRLDVFKMFETFKIDASYWKIGTNCFNNWSRKIICKRGLFIPFQFQLFKTWEIILFLLPLQSLSIKWYLKESNAINCITSLFNFSLINLECFCVQWKKTHQPSIESLLYKISALHLM